MSELTEKARALADEATEGPWLAHGLEPLAFPRLDTLEQFPWGSLAWVPTERTGREQAHRDLAFIAEARTLVPALCDENDELRGELNIAVERGNGWRTMVREDTEKAGEQAARIRELVVTLKNQIEIAERLMNQHTTRSIAPTDHEEGT